MLFRSQTTSDLLTWRSRLEQKTTVRVDVHNTRALRIARTTCLDRRPPLAIRSFGDARSFPLKGGVDCRSGPASSRRLVITVTASPPVLGRTPALTSSRRVCRLRPILSQLLNLKASKRHRSYRPRPFPSTRRTISLFLSSQVYSSRAARVSTSPALCHSYLANTST